MAYDAMEATNPSEKIRLIIRALGYYPLCTEAWSILGYHYMKKGSDLNNSLVAFETAVSTARRANPCWGPERTEPLEWGYIEHRPYLRSLSGLALVHAKMGNVGLAIEVAELMRRWEVRRMDSKLMAYSGQPLGRCGGARVPTSGRLFELWESLFHRASEVSEASKWVQFGVVYIGPSTRLSSDEKPLCTRSSHQ
mmetsp:Transcript_31958/g.73511  ORF Transcript_31958/g.73511 Transcript_31958/m.73511 type:complete len:195 (-) Transcript_31958:1976-2560(-)